MRLLPADKPLVPRWPVVLIAAIVLPACVVPLAHAVIAAIAATTDTPTGPVDPAAIVLPPAVGAPLAHSLAWAGAIALLSVALAIGPAWLLRRARSPLVPLLALPLLVPT